MVVKKDWAAGKPLTAAQVSTLLANPALEYVTSADIPSAQYVSVPDAFSANCNDYLIVISGLDFGALSSIYFYFELADGTKVSTNYSAVIGYQEWGSTSQTGIATSSWRIYVDAGIEERIIKIQNPFLEEYSWLQSTYTEDPDVVWMRGRHASATSYTRFRIEHSTLLETTDGQIDVYGYRQA